MPYHTKNSTIFIFIGKCMEAKKYLGGLFKKMSSRIFFSGLVALSPAKREFFMANCKSSYGADLLDNVAKSSYCNRLIATVGSSIYFLNANIASKLLLSLNIFVSKVFKR